MKKLQLYIFLQILWPLLAILAGLSAIAVLTQGLSQLDLVVDEQRSAWAFLRITLLATPQLLSLVLPLALFFAVIYAINRLQSESEIAVAYSAGMSNWQIISPILKLALLAAVAHLSFTTLVQPASFRAMRATLYELRADLAASLVREGTFTTPAPGLTIYAREIRFGGALRDLLIHDERSEEAVTTFTAHTGWVATVEGEPALIMQDGQVQQPKPDGGVDLLNFDQYVLSLGDFFEGDSFYVLKSSDRYLGELFFPDMTSPIDRKNKTELLAEGHARLAAPLLNFAMALIAAATMLTGDFRRLGYTRRIITASALALLVRLAAIGVGAACADTPALNPLQYALPGLASLIAVGVLIRARPKRTGAKLSSTFAPA